MGQAVERTLEAWAKEQRQALDATIRQRIQQANYDLYFGPVGDGAVGDPADGSDDWAGYPGFTKATAEIADALDAVPSRLFLDVDAEYWTDHEPEGEKCEECHGEGATEGEKCDLCNGVGVIEPAWECWYEVDRKELLRAIVGKELVAYL